MALTKVTGFGIGTIVDNVVMTSDDPTITMTDSSGTTDIATLVATSGALIVTARDGNSDGEIIFKGDTGSAVTEHARIASTGLMTVISEGNAVQTSVQQGLCKAWAHIDGTGTLNVEDSFNMASVTDTSAGTYTPQIANDMNSGSYVVTLAAEVPSTAANNAQRIFSLAAGSYGLQFYESANPADVDPIVTAVFGDLA